jgi:hypothetical protein
MHYNHDYLKKLPEMNQWLILFLGYYADHKLEGKYNKEYKASSIKAGYLCHDGRRVPTVRRYLESINLIQPSYSTQEILTPIDANVEPLLAGYSKEPVFDVSGYTISKKHHWSSDEPIAMSDRGEAYIKLDDFNAYEIIHVYLNQNEYDIKLFKHTSSGSGRYGSSTNTIYYVKAFPKKHIDSIDDTIIIAHNETYAKAHAQTVLSKTFRCRFRALKDDLEFLTLESIQKRIQKVKEKQRLLHRVLKELRVIERKSIMKGDTAYQEAILKTSMAYLKRQAPLWVNNGDLDERKLAMLILKGTSITTETTE